MDETLIERMQKLKEGLVKDEYPKCAKIIDDAICEIKRLDEENENLFVLVGQQAKEMERSDKIIKELNKLDAAIDVNKAIRFLQDYTFEDSRRIYTNGSRLVPFFRVRQALEDKAYNGFMEG